jgi:drug/metabolite transporter superfamily protein YnfA
MMFVLGIFEVGGGYLIWIGMRDKYRPALTIPMGCIILAAYGFIPTLQPSDSFGRIFAVYGGFFIVSFLLELCILIIQFLMVISRFVLINVQYLRLYVYHLLGSVVFMGVYL